MSKIRMKRWAKGYNVLALNVFNVIVLLLALNFFAFLVYRIDHITKFNPVVEKYGSLVYQAYVGWEKHEVEELLDETWTRTMQYQPFVQFKERPFAGKYVNISEHGFREIAERQPWPLDTSVINIFVFGGSTTFGYGVSDGETIPSHLKEILSSQEGNLSFNVYNFGVGHYYSTQERILFQQLLSSGLLPDIAVFVDGLNDYSNALDKPIFSDRLTQVLDQEKSENHTLKLMEKTSLFRMVNFLIKKGRKTVPNSENSEPNLNKKALAISQKYLSNKRMIQASARDFGVETLFVIQPVPFVGSEVSVFVGNNSLENVWQYGYRYLSEYKMEKDFLWLVNMKCDYGNEGYVDAVHYNSVFCSQIAEKIGHQVLKIVNKSD